MSRLQAAAPLLARTIAFSVGYAAAVWAAYDWAAMGDHPPALWLGGGLLAAALLILEGRWRAVAMALSAGAGFIVMLFVGEPALRAALTTLVDLAEATGVAFLGARFCGLGRRAGAMALLRLGVLAMMPMVAASAVLGVAVWTWLGAASFRGEAGDVFTTHLLGMAIVLPAALLIARRAEYRDFRRSPGEVVGLLAGLAVLTWGIFGQDRLVLFFLIFPAVTVIAWRLGPVGAAAAGLTIAAIRILLLLQGMGPSVLVNGLDLAGQLHLAQGMVVAAMVTGVTAGAALAEQARMRRMLIDRERAIREIRARLRRREAPT